jgi:hypothetical protein
MGAVKCLPQKEDKQEETEQSKVGSTAAGSEGDFEAQLREMQKKYAESQAALEAQVKVCKVQEQRINDRRKVLEYHLCIV